MEVRSLGYRTDLMVRRLAGASITDRGGYTVVRTPDNPTFHWGNFLLWEAPPEHGEIGSWISAFADEFPESAHTTFGADGTELPEQPDHGYPAGLELDLGVVMTSTGPGQDVRADGGVVIRALGSEGDWRQSVALRHTLDSEDHPLPPGHSQFVARSTVESRRLVDQGHGAYFGAFVEDRLRSVVGIVSDGRGPARFQNVGTHPAHRRRGLASALLARAGAFGLSQLGSDRLVIVADHGGPAVDLYRSLGFTPVETQWGLSSSTGPGPAPQL